MCEGGQGRGSGLASLIGGFMVVVEGDEAGEGRWGAWWGGRAHVFREQGGCRSAVPLGNLVGWKGFNRIATGASTKRACSGAGNHVTK